MQELGGLDDHRGLGPVMTMNFSVRTGKEEDVTSIRRLLAEWLDQPIPRKESLRRAIRKKEVLVAENGDGVVGFLHQAIREDIIDGSPNSFITAIYVDARHRNSGVGAALIEEALNRAKRAGVTRAEISTTSAKARRFYRRHRFRHFPREVILERILAAG